MSTHYPMRRFPDQPDDSPHTLHRLTTPEAREYGVGAFCWRWFNGQRYIVLCHPDRYYTNSRGEPITVSAWPVTPGEAHPWTWDGNLDTPTLSPSLSLQTKRPPRGADGKYLEDGDWEQIELFHGVITGGVLEVL